jgi:hypothetical protein
VQKIRRSLVPMVTAYADTFTSTSGLKVLADMEASYGGECYVKGDLYETLYRSYNRDVIERIKYMISLSGLEVEEEEENVKE